MTPSGQGGNRRRLEKPGCAFARLCIERRGRRVLHTGGQRDIDESFLVIINAYHEDLDFHFPSLAAPMSWEQLVDTSQPTGLVADGRLYAPGEIYRLQARSFALFIDRSPRLELPGRNLFSASLVRAVDADSSEEDA